MLLSGSISAAAEQESVPACSVADMVELQDMEEEASNNAGLGCAPHEWSLPPLCGAFVDEFEGVEEEARDNA
jgi:hypothetical protein